MLKITLAILPTFFFLNRYMRTRYPRYLWAVTVGLFVVALQVHHEVFVPSHIFYARLGWFKYPFAVALLLAGLSLFWVCFAPLRKHDNPKKDFPK